MLAGGGFIVLDTEVTPELEVEGVARDLVRAVQQARREAGLDVSDRIRLEISGAETVYRAVNSHRSFIGGEVLASGLSVATDIDDLTVANGASEVIVGERFPARIRIKRA